MVSCTRLLRQGATSASQTPHNQIQLLGQMLRDRTPFISIHNSKIYEIPPSPSQLNSKPLLEIPNLELTTKDALAVIGPPHSRLPLLKTLTGRYFPVPQTSFRYPFYKILAWDPSQHLRFVDFSGVGGGAGLLGKKVKGTYYGARFESFYEDGEEVTVRNFMGGEVPGLGIEHLLDSRVMGLSNGEARRVRIGKEVLRVGVGGGLVIDDPFVGLDPEALKRARAFIGDVARTESTERWRMMILGLRESEGVPDFITQIIRFGDDGRISYIGKPDPMLTPTFNSSLQQRKNVGSQPAPVDVQPPSPNTPIRISNLSLPHPDPTRPPLLKSLSFSLPPGTALRIVGPNGSGKSTLLSILLSEHPLSYSSDVHFWGSTRVPEPGKLGIPLEKIQRRIGMASPELHALVPQYSRDGRDLTALEVVLSGASPERELNNFRPGKVTLESLPPSDGDRIAAMQRYFSSEISEEAWNSAFHSLPTSHQRAILFLRAVAAQQEMVLLDEAFSGMETGLRDLCWKWLKEEWGKSGGVLVCVSHLEEEVPSGWAWSHLRLLGDGEWQLE